MNNLNNNYTKYSLNEPEKAKKAVFPTNDFVFKRYPKISYKMENT